MELRIAFVFREGSEWKNRWDRVATLIFREGIIDRSLWKESNSYRGGYWIRVNFTWDNVLSCVTCYLWRLINHRSDKEEGIAINRSLYHDDIIVYAIKTFLLIIHCSMYLRNMVLSIYLAIYTFQWTEKLSPSVTIRSFTVARDARGVCEGSSLPGGK